MCDHGGRQILVNNMLNESDNLSMILAVMGGSRSPTRAYCSHLWGDHLPWGHLPSSWLEITTISNSRISYLSACGKLSTLLIVNSSQSFAMVNMIQWWLANGSLAAYFQLPIENEWWTMVAAFSAPEMWCRAVPGAASASQQSTSTANDELDHWKSSHEMPWAIENHHKSIHFAPKIHSQTMATMATVAGNSSSFTDWSSVWLSLCTIRVCSSIHWKHTRILYITQHVLSIVCKCKYVDVYIYIYKLLWYTIIRQHSAYITSNYSNYDNTFTLCFITLDHIAITLN